VFESVEATTLHAHAIAPLMRAADLAELDAHGCDPLEALLRGVADSVYCRTLLADGVPAMMWGVTQITDTVWSPWALGTDAINTDRRGFMVFSREELDRVVAKYPVLFNHVDYRNAPAIRWLQWLGFEMMEPEPIGVDGALFHPFILRAA
jgi:hypothetical protein